MSKILAIETATEACSAALLLDNNEIIEHFKIAPREHTKLLLPMMDEVLNEGGIVLKDIDAIAFSRGPGAFTGLRISAGVAQGAALSVDKPVIPVSTLEALALSVPVENDWQDDDLIISALDARMGEVYWGVFHFQKNNIQVVLEETISKPEEMMVKVNDLMAAHSDIKAFLVGPGWDAYEGELFKSEKPEHFIYLKDALPRAGQIARLAATALLQGKTVPAEDAQPVYIRNNVAKKKADQTKKKV